MSRGKLILAAIAAVLVVAFLLGQGKQSGTSSTAITSAETRTAPSDVIVTRDAALAQKYGTPGPRRCATAAPPGDSLTQQQALAYLACGIEGEAGDGTGLYLATNVSAQLGQPRSYDYAIDAMDTSIDPDKQVYDIRGSAEQFTCVAPGSSMAQIWGAQCRVGPSNNLKGICYKTTFGEWRCLAHDATHDRTTETNSAPPGADL